MYFFLILTAAVLGADSLSDRYYSFRTPCSRGITLGQMSECIQKESNRSEPIISLEPLDPMPADDFVIKAGSFLITNKKVVLKGLKDVVVEDVLWDMKDFTGTIQLSGSSVLTCDYEMDGKVFYIPVTSSGSFSVGIDDAKYQLTFQFRKVEDDSGVEHVYIYDIITKPTLDNLKFQITSSIVHGFLDTALEAALNRNWKLIAPDAPTYAAKSIAKTLGDAVNKIYYQIPIDDILQPVEPNSL